MPLHHYVTLGRSGLRVSPFCLGAMTFGDESWGASAATSRSIIDRFLERGGNFIDTANGYTQGRSEKILGEHLGRHPHKRERVVLATKFFTSLFTGDPNGGGAGRKALIAQCEESLRRLETDYIDLYWMHCWDVHTPIEETMRALDDLVRAGKIRYAGFSDTPAWKVAQAQTLAAWRNWAPLCALQIEYSLLERTVEGELVPAARELGLGITPWSPLKFGALSGKYTRENTQDLKPEGRGAWLQGVFTERTHKILDALRTIAVELGSTPARVALAWVQNRPGVTSTIVGVRSLEQLDDNLAAIDLALRPEHLSALDKLSEPTLPFPVSFVKNVGPMVGHGGATVNGITAPPWPYAPKNDAERA